MFVAWRLVGSRAPWLPGAGLGRGDSTRAKPLKKGGIPAPGSTTRVLSLRSATLRNIPGAGRRG